jgi:hypothetical protein
MVSVDAATRPEVPIDKTAAATPATTTAERNRLKLIRDPFDRHRPLLPNARHQRIR